MSSSHSTLEFAVRHNVRPIIETFKMADVNTAIERVQGGKIRYRAVLEL